MLHHMLRAAAQRAFSVLDPYFQYVTMLLHGDGTNGAQNNTFLDSSTNNFTITRNGNTTQGTFTPYGSNWSNYFDGSSNLALSSAPVSATGAFTIECWVYITGTAASQSVYSQYLGADAGRWMILWNDTANKFTFAVGASTSYDSTSTYAANTWYHIAWVRDGSNNLSFYINGVRDSTNASVTTSLSTSNPTIANRGGGATPYYGYISNLRITNTAVYSGTTYTVPTAPLTNISGTTLLTCQSNRFVDNETTPLTFTISGSPSVQRFSPFSPTTAYSTSVIGGSGYFDGTGDYLSAANATALQLSGSQFTIEGWFYLTVGSTDNNELVCQSSGSADANVNFQVRVTSANKLRFLVMSGASPTYIDSTVTITTNSWHYFACVCDGSGAGAFLRMWVNGVYQTASSSFNASGINTNTAATQVGAWTFSSQYVTGYITDLRILKGTALYTGTSNITVPTAPLTAITNTSLLLNYTNAGILDNAMMNDLETVGNAQISTSVKKYGTGSMYFDGTGDYLVPSAPNSNVTLGLGSGDFTVEFWVYFIGGLGSDIVLFDGRPLSTNGAYPTIYVNSSSQVSYVVSSADRITSASAFSTSTWYHIAVARSGTSTKMFVNGTQVGSTYTDSTNYLSASRRPVIAINGFNETAAPLNGYIDDLRITKGVARYTANFTAPTAAFPNN